MKIQRDTRRIVEVNEMTITLTAYEAAILTGIIGGLTGAVAADLVRSNLNTKSGDFYGLPRPTGDTTSVSRFIRELFNELTQED